MKIRGTASHIAEKYVQLARDAQSSGDPVAAENYYQHAEHYFRLIAAAQEQLRQTQPYFQQQQGEMRGNTGDDEYDDSEGDQPSMGGEPFAPQPQPFYPREQQQQPQQFHQPQQQQPQQQPQQHYQPRAQHVQTSNDSDIDRLPSFITGGQPPPAAQHSQGGNGQNGQNGYDGAPDRFPLHRRRRRHRSGGPREHGTDHSMSGDNAPQGESNDE